MNKNARRFGYVVVREDLHASVETIVSSPRSLAAAESFAARCSEQANEAGSPYVYSVRAQAVG